jgi:hypothetical protein
MSRAQLLECKEDLQSGEPAIRDEMARLEAVKKVCDSVGKKMEDVVQRGDERVGDLENRGEVSVDEVVCGISIVHNQLVPDHAPCKTALILIGSLISLRRTMRSKTQSTTSAGHLTQNG